MESLLKNTAEGENAYGTLQIVGTQMSDSAQNKRALSFFMHIKTEIMK